MNENNVSLYNEKLEREMQNAKKIYGHFHSTHELYAVLIEEVDEFWDLVKDRPGEWKKEKIINELMQISAVVLRGINELKNNEIKHI